MKSCKHLGPLHEHWREIAKECRLLPHLSSLDASEFSTREAVLKALNGKPQWIRGWDGHAGWYNWGIAINYQYPMGDAHLPFTVGLLKKIPRLKFASLSLFKPGTLLPVHEHPELANEKLHTFHLGLDVPPNCYLGIDDTIVQEENGLLITFDGSKPHFSTNESNRDRLILYGEFVPESN